MRHVLKRTRAYSLTNHVFHPHPKLDNHQLASQANTYGLIQYVPECVRVWGWLSMFRFNFDHQV